MGDPMSEEEISTPATRRMDMDAYVKACGKRSPLMKLFRSISMHINSQWNFSWRLRVGVYRLLGIDIERAARGTYVAREVFFDDVFPELIHIEAGAVISWRVTLFCHSTLNGERYVGPVRIGRGAMIGTGAIIMPGVVVGDGATVGCGTVVTKDVPDYAVIRGASPVLIEAKSSDERRDG